MKKTLFLGGPGSIRGTLTAALLVGAGTVVLLIALLLDHQIRAFLQQRYDRDLLRGAEMLITLTKETEEGVELDFAGEFMPRFETPAGGHFFELWLPNGELLEASESLAGGHIPLPNQPVTAAVFQDLDGHPLGRCRVVRLSFVPQREGEEEDGPFDAEGFIADDQALSSGDQPVMTLLLARRRDEFDAFLHLIRAWIWGSQALLLAFIIVLVRLALQRGLRPLDAIRDQVQKIDHENLATRIVPPTQADELTPVVQQLNALLQRLDEAVARERRFTSDVAHELRTPLAELRTLSEVGLRNRDDTALLTGFLEDVHEVGLEMQQLVENLLELSRCDGGRRMLVTERVDLVQVVAKAWARAQPQAGSRTLALDAPTSLTVTTDRALIEHIVQNLVNNAATHGPDGCRIAVTLEAAPHPGLTISNPAPDLEAADLSCLYDRFWQKDAARTGGKNTGLGLAIVHAFCQHGGIQLDTSLVNHNLIFKLRFPATPPPAAHGDGAAG
ncbi:ATP-binding protein [Acanthopleuribacter pedis]|uniref:histidine kinase n=1 Tax=Acanthopleuribacter pedis TaxID=442870 RepID=A0A8J7QL54_9BACT|nr:ATP-binding protein [Acanthopleuribacter pedis]MBO1323111.1 HAMP domain-containing protein [Acanthopleuribacter pedis]